MSASNLNLLGSNLPQYVAPEYTNEQNEQMNVCKNALHWFKIFSTPWWKSQKYAVLSGREGNPQYNSQQHQVYGSSSTYRLPHYT